MRRLLAVLVTSVLLIMVSASPASAITDRETFKNSAASCTGAIFHDTNAAGQIQGRALILEPGKTGHLAITQRGNNSHPALYLPAHSWAYEWLMLAGVSIKRNKYTNSSGRGRDVLIEDFWTIKTKIYGC